MSVDVDIEQAVEDGDAESVVSWISNGSAMDHVNPKIWIIISILPLITSIVKSLNF